jgi:KDO2-lipid IV(A) lauroyltransferase
MVESELGLRETDWPLARQDVLGDRDGAGAWCQYLALRSLLAVVSRIPIRLRDALAASFARVAKAAFKKRSGVAREFVRQALGPGASDARVEELVLAGWRHLFTIVLRNSSYTRTVGTGSPASRISVTMPPEVERVIAERKGAILVSAHAGDWEAGGAALPWVGFKPLYVISRPPRNRPLSRHFQSAREAHHVRLVPRHGAAAAMPAILAAGANVLLFLDQRANKKFVMAPFFGRRAKCERTASVFLRRMHAPVVFYACYLTDRPFHYELCFTRVLRPDELEGKDPVEIMTIVNQELEKLILAHPEQYFWLHDRFRNRKKVAAPAVARPAQGDGVA